MDSWFCAWAGTQGEENKLDTAMGRALPGLWVTGFFLFMVWFLVWGFLLVCLVLLLFFLSLCINDLKHEEDMEAFLE